MNDTEFNITRVYLMLGSNCNYACRHCIQTEQHRKEGARIERKSLAYIRHLAAIRPPQLQRLTVMFWGGEPLLYMDVIQETVAALGDCVSYSMVSNGALLNEEIVEFINANGIHYVLSNDGPLTAEVRDENLLENAAFLRLFKRIERKSIDAVISAYNQDYYALWNYLEEKLPGIPVSTEFLHCTWDMPEDLYAFDLPKYQESIRQIVGKAHDDTIKGQQSREVQLLQPYRDDIIRFVKKLDKGEDAIIPFPRCAQMRKCVNLDLLGNVYACHNFADKLGTVEDDFEALLSRYDQWQASRQDPLCAQCQYTFLCRGGCPYVGASAAKARCCEIVGAFMQGCLDYVGSFADVFEKVEL